MHLDSTSSFHLHGDYDTGEPRDEDHPEAAITITHGSTRAMGARTSSSSSWT